mgnify:CR=1 FL=1
MPRLEPGSPVHQSAVLAVTPHSLPRCSPCECTKLCCSAASESLMQCEASVVGKDMPFGSRPGARWACPLLPMAHRVLGFQWMAAAHLCVRHYLYMQGRPLLRERPGRNHILRPSPIFCGKLHTTYPQPANGMSSGGSFMGAVPPPPGLRHAAALCNE